MRKWKIPKRAFIYLLLDTSLAMISLIIAQIIRPYLNNISTIIDPVSKPYQIDLSVFFLLTISWGVCFFLINSYPSKKKVHLINKIKFHFLSSLISIASCIGIYLLINKALSRLFLLTYGIIATFILFIPRLLHHIQEKENIFNKLLIQTLLIPTITLTAYSLLFSSLCTIWLPEGVNIIFTLHLSRILIFILVIFLLSLGYLFPSYRNIKLSVNERLGKINFQDLLILLIPMSTVVQYLIINKDILSLLDILIILIVTLLFVFLLAFLVPRLLNSFSPFRLQSAIGLSFVFTILNMSSLSRIFTWSNQGNILIQIGFLLLSFFLFYLLLGIKGKSEFVIVIITFFLFSLINPLFLNSSAEEDIEGFDVSHPILSKVQSGYPSMNPNIYLLVYDAYISNETMQGYGIDNSDQETYLRENGFEIYPKTYSIDANTTGTMSRVLNASSSFLGNQRKGVSGDGVVHQALNYLQYETYGVFYSDYMFRGYGSSYDVSLPKEISIQPYAYLLSAIALGEFKFDLEVDLEFSKVSYSEFLTNKEKIFTQDQELPIFLYAHSPYPGHSQNSGACLPNEVELFKERLSIANQEMKKDIELLIKDKNSIIIVAGDHGPYLTKNCTSTSNEYDISEITRLDIQDRYGTFLAIRWPDDNYHDYDDITVIQDLFVAIFAYLYEDPTLLENKIQPETLRTFKISDARVVDGVIFGGINDGEKLFLNH